MLFPLSLRCENPNAQDKLPPTVWLARIQKDHCHFVVTFSCYYRVTTETYPTGDEVIEISTEIM